MSLPALPRQPVSLAAAAFVSFLLCACGGGGGGESGGPSNTPVRTALGVPTRTPGGSQTRTPTSNSSRTSAPTVTRTPSLTPTITDTPEPTPTLTPTTAIVAPGGSIAAAAKRAPAGSVVVISPGTYEAVVLGPGDVQDSVTLLADVTGVLTDSSAAAVTVNARGQSAAIAVSGQSNLTLDGFTLRGAEVAGMLVTASPGTTVRNCVFDRNAGDGLRFQQVTAGLAFNNLVIRNGAAGIRIDDSDGARAINNTVYNNAGSGLDLNGNGAVDARNNIFDGNRPSGIVIDPTRVAYQGDFNLNNDGYQGLLSAPHDIVGRDPLFIFPDGDDFHLQAYAGGTTSPAVDAGDFDTDANLVTLLTQASTQTDGMPDAPPVDVGYHYVQVAATPTPRPRPTRTSTPRGTVSRTPTGPTPTATTTPVGRPTRTPRPTRPPH